VAEPLHQFRQRCTRGGGEDCTGMSKVVEAQVGLAGGLSDLSVRLARDRTPDPTQQDHPSDPALPDALNIQKRREGGPTDTNRPNGSTGRPVQVKADLCAHDEDAVR